MRYGCIGEKLGHSFSAKIHTLLGDADYELKELRPEEVPGFIGSGDFLGVNVTIPYKETVIPYLDGIDRAAQKIGAVNTVVTRGGKRFGYNTDFAGMVALFSFGGISVKGKTVAILGSGGTSKTAKAVCESLGAKSILVVSRTAGDGKITYKDLAERSCSVGILINTTPVGMFPDNDASPIDLSAFPSLSGVVDVIYNPLKTKLILEAEKRGIPAVSGLMMLCAQGVFASEIFHGEKYPEGTVERVYRTLASASRNAVLIGMPCASKTTVGKLLAKALDRPFYDTDAIFTERYGEIAPFFERFGEAAFREKESEIIAKLAKKSGVVIATGGGAVLRTENVERLKQNGTILLLDRALSALTPDASRPTAATKDAIKKIYRERMPLYESAADVTVKIIEKDGAPDAESAVKELLPCFLLK